MTVRRFVLAAVVFVSLGCAGGPVEADAGPQDDVFARLEVELLSPWSARVHVATHSPSERTLELTPGDHRPIVLRGDETSRVVFNLEPGTEYVLSVTAALDEGSVSRQVRATTAAASKKRVLFDAAHGQTAANADWRIDDDNGAPRPADPSSESDWTGSYSAWGYELHRTGRYEVASLRSGALTYGTGDDFDLADFDVLVLPEPNNWGDMGRRTNVEKGRAEREAILAFVRAGGGLVMLADHVRSDRDNDGVESIDVLNALLSELACGMSFNSVDLYEHTRVFGGSPVVVGPFGRLENVSVYNGTSMTVARGSSAEAAVFRAGVTDPTSNMAHNMVLGATCTAEAGRIFAYGDSSIANDGTGGDPRNAWTEDWKSHRRMLLNATEWTARVY